MIKRLLFLSFFISVLSSNAQTTIVDSIISGGIYRSYRLYVPAIYNGSSARPLIFNLHGYTSNAQAQQFYSNFEPIADTANFLMVYPQGTKDGSNQPYWNSGINASGVNDIQFLSNLIDSIDVQYNINLNRIYSCGLSNGGFMSQTLACELSNRITAIASVAGSMYITQYGNNCHVARPMPMLQVAGTADGTVPYAGNSFMMPIDSVVKYWVKKNNCNPAAVFSNVPNTNTGDGCTAEHYVYNNGNLGSTVELYKVIGGGHTWPGSPFTIGVTNQDFSASKEIWRFFNQFNLSSLTSVSEFDKKESFSVYPNPAKDKLIITNSNLENNKVEITICNLVGNIVSTYPPLEGAGGGILYRELDTKNLTSGIYFLSIKQNGVEVGNVKFVKE